MIGLVSTPKFSILFKNLTLLIFLERRIGIPNHEALTWLFASKNFIFFSIFSFCFSDLRILILLSDLSLMNLSKSLN